MTSKARLCALEKKAVPERKTEIMVFTEILDKPGRFKTKDGKEYTRADMDLIQDTPGQEIIKFIVTCR